MLQHYRDYWILYALSAYILLFMAVAVGLTVWKSKRRRDRVPVKFKLLRGPGESLRRRIAKAEENFGEKMAAAALVPILATGIPIAAMSYFRPKTGAHLIVWLSVITAFFLGTLVLAIRWAIRDLVRYRSDRLGYLGEREVAEHLQCLLARGYRIFHDVPAEGSGKPFNLDHVAIGPRGVALIETKTRRKGRARPGMKDHVVTYDGNKLIWPWGEDSHGLQQAQAEADWLKKFIKQRTNIDTPVKPILAIPGWWVEAKAYKPVTVVNSKNVAAAVTGNGSDILTEEQIDLIARQLDQLCRDVDD